MLNSPPVGVPKELFYKPARARLGQQLFCPTKGNSFKKGVRFRKASELLD